MTPTSTARATISRERLRAQPGQRRADPGSLVNLRLTVAALDPLRSAELSDTFPSAWRVFDAGGGNVVPLDATTSRITWKLGSVPAGGRVAAGYTLAAPAQADPGRGYAFQASLVHSAGSLKAEPWLALVSTAVAADRYRFGADRPLGAPEWLAAADAPLAGLPRFEAFRLRFQVANRDDVPATWGPRLEWSSRPDQGFEPVPVDAPSEAPFYVRRSRVAGGSAIAAGALGLGPGVGRAEPGRLFDEENGSSQLALGPGAHSEVEYSLRATLTAAWRTDYYFRLTDAGVLLSGASAVRLTIGEEPGPELTQPSFPGRPVGGADVRAEARPGAGLGSPDVAVAAAAAPATRPLAAATNPHAGYTASTDACAACHRTHTARSSALLAPADPASSGCLACHDGTGAASNVAAQYSDPRVPADNPGAAAFYSHPALAAGSSHTRAGQEEFRGVLNRHSACVDCHSPHQADPGAAATMASAGWRASGATRAVSGVGATFGGAGTAPSYAWKLGVEYEHELCLKCHSGYTTLLSYARPSQQQLDKGREIDPANGSFHPIAAPGTNPTAALTRQLSAASPSPYKLWAFTPGQVVRCVNCHGDFRLANPAAPPAASARLSPHTSRYRGLLMANYRSRDLKPYSSTNNYSAADFALCYQCHGEAPFRGTSSADTNFGLHSLHLARIYDQRSSGSLDIDTPGAGQGNAICAECHYRLHSTTFAPYAGQQNASRLVSFAPNVVGASGSGAPTWSQSSRTCSLTCHGERHSSERY